MTTKLGHPVAPVTTTEGGPLHPYGFIGDPTVLVEDGRYRMWFTSSRQDLACQGGWGECLVQGFAYAESVDGEHWDDAWITPDDPDALTRLVLEPTTGGWDELGIETASVLRDRDGRLRLYYTGHRGTSDPDLYPFWDAIGMAVSDDGVTWTKSEAPVFEAALPWEQVCCDPACTCRWGGVLEPSVLLDPQTGLYRMWYVGFGEREGLATYRIGHATSEDGVVWERSPEPVLDVGPADAWDGHLVSHVDVIADPCSGYHLFYHGTGPWSDASCGGTPGCMGFTPGAIGAAWSLDGLTWEKTPEPILEPSTGEWDGFFLGGPDAVLREGSLELFYFGNRDIDEANVFNSQIGHIVSVCE